MLLLALIDFMHVKWIWFVTLNLVCSGHNMKLLHVYIGNQLFTKGKQLIYFVIYEWTGYFYVMYICNVN